MKRSVDIEAARIKAECLLHYLRPVCVKAEIAGSIRREKPMVGDIEIVAMPRMYEPEERDLFGNVIGQPHDRIDQALLEANIRESRPACDASCPWCEGKDPGRCFDGTPWLSRLNNGERYLKLHDNYLEIQIDLFLVRPPAEWGPIFAIRTGPADFSQKLVTGLRVRKMRCIDGHVVKMKDGVHVTCETEERFFKLAGLRWKEPKDRR